MPLALGRTLPRNPRLPFRAKTAISLKESALSDVAIRKAVPFRGGGSRMRGRVRVLAGAAGGVWAFLVVGCSPVADPIVQASQGASTDSGIDAPEGRLIPVCGDGYRDGDEFCDDYENPTPGFGCDSTCSFELKAYCSDGVVTSPEVCDADPLYCGKNCTEIIGSCGDGNLQTPIEQCDAKGESATCDADCTVVECGDGVVNGRPKRCATTY